MRQKRKLRDALLISISDLRVGMFVVELDRPWEKTSFMLQGFLLTELLDCQTLQGMVRELTIDPSRSDPSALLHLPWDSVHLPPDEEEPRAEKQTTVRVSYSAPPAKIDESYSLGALTNGFKQIWQAFTDVQDAPRERKVRKNSLATSSDSAQSISQPAPYYLRYASVGSPSQAVSMAERSAQLVPPSTASFSQFIEELYPRDVVYAPLNFYERMQGWIIEWKAAKPYKSTRKQKQFSARKQHPEYIPTTLNLVIYKDRAPMQEEIKHATVAVSRTQEFWQNV